MENQPREMSLGWFFEKIEIFFKKGWTNLFCCAIIVNVDRNERSRRCNETYGGVAQLGECLLRMQEVEGSNPFVSTSK